MQTTKRIAAKNLKSGKVRTYSSARAASKALNGLGTPGSEKTITKWCKAGGGKFRNSWVTYSK
jgi:hypothetical protein